MWAERLRGKPLEDPRDECDRQSGGLNHDQADPQRRGDLSTFEPIPLQEVSAADGGLGAVGLAQRRHIDPVLVALDLLHETLAERAGVVVQVPVEGFRQEQALRGLQSQRADVVQHHEHGDELLPGLDDAELGRLLHRIDGVRPGAAEADDLGAGGSSSSGVYMPASPLR